MQWETPVRYCLAVWLPGHTAGVSQSPGLCSAAGRDRFGQNDPFASYHSWMVILVAFGPLLPWLKNTCGLTVHLEGVPLSPWCLSVRLPAWLVSPRSIFQYLNCSLHCSLAEYLQLGLAAFQPWYLSWGNVRTFFKVDWKFLFRSHMQNSWMCILNVELLKTRKKYFQIIPRHGGQSSIRECYSWVLKWLENFLWMSWAERSMPCTEEMLPSLPHLPGGRVATGPWAPSTPCPQSSSEWVGQPRAGRGTCEEHRAGINHAG